MVITNVRFPEKELHEALVASAKKNRRSINSEMLHAFEYYLEHTQEAKKQEEKAKTTK